MLRLTSISFVLILIVTVATAHAQTENTGIDQRDFLTVTASASEDRVRFTAGSSDAQIRLEVYDSRGTKLVDNDLAVGNVLDWDLRNAQGERLPDDEYLCVVTVKRLSGKATKRIASLTLSMSTVSMQELARSSLTQQQTDAIGPVEVASLTVIDDDRNRTTTVLAHNGTDGRVTRGSGALTFRLGDLYSGKDKEQMRLTPEGDLGVGITHPEARLDVDGLIHSSQGIVFPDGSVQFSAARRTYGAASLRSSESQKKQIQGEDARLAPDTSGTGTTGQIPKWLDGPNGVLSDSNITELTGAIGINGPPDTRFRLDVNGSTRIRGSNPGFNLEGLRAGGNIWLFQTVDDDGRFRLFGQDNVNPGVERLTISLSTGNVGIGATSPASKLDVAGSINTTTQYNLGGNRVLSTAGTQNLFVGINAGTNNTGTDNAFFGNQAGESNTSGNFNAFFGSQAGQANTTGNGNAFFGLQAGESNTTGGTNAFFGGAAGASNTTGFDNSFFGALAGQSNTTGNFNAFFGTAAGQTNTSDNNAFFGFEAGTANTNGSNNSFFGTSAGRANTTGGGNAFFGWNAGFFNTTGNVNSFFGNAAGKNNTTGIQNSFFGDGAGISNTTGINNSFFGALVANNHTTGGNNTFMGAGAGTGSTTGNNNTFIGSNAGNINLATQVNNSTVIGANAAVSQSNTVILGSINGINGATADTSVGIGTTAPEARLHVSGGAILIDNNQGFYLKDTTGAQKRGLLADTGNRLRIGSGGPLGFDQIRFDLGTPGTVMTMFSTGHVSIGTTTDDQALTVSGNASKSVGGTTWAVFSDERLKTIKGRFTPGLSALLQLQPIRYEYKADNALALRGAGEHVGFSAQAVEKVLPEAVSRTSSGYLQLNSDPILWTMLNAIKEQQQQIEAQQERIYDQQLQIKRLKQTQRLFDALKQLVCADHPTAALCKQS